MMIPGLRKLFVDEIVPPPLGGDVAAEHMLGVVNRSAGGEVLNLINFTKVLESARQRAVVR